MIEFICQMKENMIYCYLFLAKDDQTRYIFHEICTRPRRLKVKYKGWNEDKQRQDKDCMVFNGKSVWNLGDRLERDLAERTTTEATQKYCLNIYNKILICVGSPVCKAAQIHSSEITVGWGSVRLNAMDN